MDAVFTLIASLLAIGAAWGLVYWAHRAEADRSAYVGLYLVFGFPGILLVVAGLALLVNGRGWGPLLLSLGMGLTLPLIPSFRRALARVTPIDPNSRTDMSGLCIFLGVLALLIVATAQAPDPDQTSESVSSGALLAQLVAFVTLAYVVVGTGIRRNFREATERLGLRWPSPTVIAIGLAMVIPAFIVSGIGSWLTAVIQPDVADQIQEGLENLTSDVQNPLGAIILGVSAGVGEELLFRGALQPRFGLVLTSLMFGLLHTNYGLSFITLGVLGLGMLLGVLRQRYGTVAPIITHAVFNLIVVLIQTYT